MTIDKIRKDSPEKIRLGGVGKVLADRLETLTGVECRAVVLGHVVRGGTPTATDRNLATEYGASALDMALEGKFGRMVALQNNLITSVPLSSVGGKCRKVTVEHPWVQAALDITNGSAAGADASAAGLSAATAGRTPDSRAQRKESTPAKRRRETGSRREGSPMGPISS